MSLKQTIFGYSLIGCYDYDVLLFPGRQAVEKGIVQIGALICYGVSNSTGTNSVSPTTAPEDEHIFH